MSAVVTDRWLAKYCMLGLGCNVPVTEALCQAPSLSSSMLSYVCTMMLRSPEILLIDYDMSILSLSKGMESLPGTWTYDSKSPNFCVRSSAGDELTISPSSGRFSIWRKHPVKGNYNVYFHPAPYLGLCQLIIKGRTVDYSYFEYSDFSRSHHSHTLWSVILQAEATMYQTAQAVDGACKS